MYMYINVHNCCVYHETVIEGEGLKSLVNTELMWSVQIGLTLWPEHHYSGFGSLTQKLFYVKYTFWQQNLGSCYSV